MEYSNQELLNFAVQNGIIDLNDVQDKIRMNERQKYLKMHENEIWQGKDGKWRTYLPDRAIGKRKLIKRTTEKSIKNVVVEFYKSEEQEPLIKDVFEKWMNQKLDYREIKKQSYDLYWTDYNRFFKNRYVDNFENQKICYITENDLEDFIKTKIYLLTLLTFPYFQGFPPLKILYMYPFPLFLPLWDNYKGKFIIQLFNRCLPLYQEVLRKSALLPL